MRGAVLAPGGKTILALPSTAEDGRVSRVVPFLKEGTSVTLTRGDIHYVATEYRIAYLHGKTVRERAMDLIAIAHPKFRPWLVEDGDPGRSHREGYRYHRSLEQYELNPDMHTAEVALVVLDRYQEKAVGTELLSYLTYLARRQGLLGFTAEVLAKNTSMLRQFEEMGFDIRKRREEGVYDMRMESGERI